MTLDPPAPTLPAVRLRWVDPPADNRARLFVPARPPSPGPVLLTPRRMQAACSTIAEWPCYAATPLIRLDALASRLSLGTIWLKDETKRFGVDSFKALGAGYALGMVLSAMLSRVLDRDVPVAELLKGVHRERTARLTAVAATDGNHGRALAWASRLFGCGCVIFVPPQVSEGRRAAITGLGAEVVEVAGTYDDAVRVAAQSAGRHGWIEISDTAHGGDDAVPLLVMEGYTTLVSEIEAARPGSPPVTHVFLQAGVGGFAGSILDAAACSPVLRGAAGIVVESNQAGCLFASARAAALTGVRGPLATVMAGLACGVPSTVAFEIVRRRATAFLQIADADALLAQRSWEGAGPDLPQIGETGIAGLAGLLAVCRRGDWRTRLGLSAASSVLLFATEGASPARHRSVLASDLKNDA